MNTVNPTALLRSLIVYAVCVPLAILLGYLLTNPLDYQSIGFIGVLMAILIFPLLMKWHYPLLVFSWSLPATLFFLPGHPTLFYAMVACSLSISVVERILDRNQPFLPSTAVRWPLLAFLVLIVITAKLTGGFGIRSMGSEVYGGKRYIGLFVGVLSFFAITARPIPKKHVRWYVLLYFCGAFFNVLSDLAIYVPRPLQFIYWVIPAASFGVGDMGSNDVVLGETRLASTASAAGAVWWWMLARHGFRNCFLTHKLWRPALMGVMLLLVMLGGFRSFIIGLFLVVGLLFVMEKLHRTGIMLVVLLTSLMGATLLVPLAPHLPFTFQRALAFLPLNISEDVRLNAEGSTEWRIEIWKALLPQIPKYLLLGKGYAFSAQTFNESMGNDAQFHNKLIIDASENPLALSNDFHSGPLSVIIPFGIWGALLWLWFWAAGFYVIWRNYRYGDPDFVYINRFFVAFFVGRCVGFLFVFGDLVLDMATFSGLIGLSIAINHGISKPRPAIKNQPAPAKPLPPAQLPALAR